MVRSCTSKPPQAAKREAQSSAAAAAAPACSGSSSASSCSSGSSSISSNSSLVPPLAPRRQTRAAPSPPPSAKRRKVSRAREALGTSLKASTMDFGDAASGGGAESSAGPSLSDGAGSAAGSSGAAPSEDAHQSAFGFGPGAMELNGALGSLLRRSMRQDDAGGGGSRFSSMYRDLKSDDGTRQIMALTELSEYLSFSSEEALISFPNETFIPALIGLLEDPGTGDETAAQAMILCCRCLFNIVDILPPTTRIITAAGGLPVLCAALLNVEYIDVAEIAIAIIERISEDQALQVVKAGGLSAILAFLDFFQLAVQRQAVNAASLMLAPIPPSDVFEQHIKPALPTLAQLLQHADPQVLRSACECWRRLLDGTIAVRTGARPMQSANSPSNSLGRLVAKGKWRMNERGKKEPRLEETEHVAASDNAAPASASVSIALEDLCPPGVLSNLLMLLANGVAMPSQHTSAVTAEVLYILSILTNYSGVFAKDALKQDVVALLRQLLPQMDSLRGGHSASQTGFGLLRVLSVVASILPAVHLTDTGCECEAERLSLLEEEPSFIDSLVEAFMSVSVDVYEVSMDSGLQSLGIMLLLSMLLASRGRPETLQACMDPTRIACLLSNLLLTGSSKSVILACLLIVNEILERHSQTYSQLFTRHGVVRAIHHMVTKSDELRGKDGVMETTSATSSSATACRSKSQLVDVVARRILSTYFAPSMHGGESARLRVLGNIAQQLQSPGTVTAVHREALTAFHGMLLTNDSITAFEFSCSGTAGALHLFLYPSPAAANNGMSQSQASMLAAPCPEDVDLCRQRLQLFLECVVKPPGDAFTRLVRLCIAVVQRVERQPVSLFPTNASLSTALPPHLRSQASAASVESPGSPGSISEVLSSRGFFGGGDLPGFSSRRGQDGGGSAGASSVSVLRLLAKPIRIRMAPHGIPAGASSLSASAGLNAVQNARAMLMPPRGGAAMMSGQAAAAGGGKSGGQAAVGSNDAAVPVVATSPAARLRNYLASKVSRKRSVFSTQASAPATNVIEKKSSSVASFSMSTAKGRSTASGSSGQADSGEVSNKGRQKGSAKAGDELLWPGLGISWDNDDESGVPGNTAASGATGGSSAQSGSRGSSDLMSRDQGEGGGGWRPGPWDRVGNEPLGDRFEAVLLVEPLATISALEEYVCEKRGGLFRQEISSPTSTAASTSTAAQAPGQSPAPSEAATASGPPGRGGEGASRMPFDAPRTRMSFKQSQQQRMQAHLQRQQRAAAAAQSPRAREGDMELSLNSGDGMGAGADDGPSDSEPSMAQKRVQILLNGQNVSSSTSIIQALVAHAVRASPKSKASRNTREEADAGRGRLDRFLVTIEDDSNSDGDETPSGGQQLSPRHFCGSIWGRVHSMTYTLVDDSASPRGPEVDGISTSAAAESSSQSETSGQTVVATEFDGLVIRHIAAIGRISTLMEHLKSQNVATGGSTLASLVGAESDKSCDEMTPSSGGFPEESTAEGSSRTIQETLAMMLQLVSSFHNMCEFLHASRSLDCIVDGIPVAEDFHCNTLTFKLLRQLSDPLAICTGLIPPWCTKLSGACRFLLPYGARRVLHHSCGLGLSRALQHVQQRVRAQNNNGGDAQRRLEGEVSIANIPRQKVRISRQRILESAMKVMNHYGGGSTILEVEYAGEVGTGSGPTLEFYAQVADILQSTEPRLFRKGTPSGMLFPEPALPRGPGEDQAAGWQHVLDCFRLLGQVVAKCILDGRLVDLHLHPLFWRAVLRGGPVSRTCLREVDPELANSLNQMRNMDDATLSQLSVDFTLPGHPEIELKPGGSETVSQNSIEEYIDLVAETSLVTAVAPQVKAFRTAFQELLPLETCQIWCEEELTSIVGGSSVMDDSVWTVEHLSAHIKAQHGYNAESRCLRDLIATMASFSQDDRRRFLTFTTGAPALPLGGFGGLKPPLTVVKKEAPPAPASPDHFMPSVMTCANYLKLPEYSSAEILRQKLDLAMSEGQSAFLLS